MVKLEHFTKATFPTPMKKDHWIGGQQLCRDFPPHTEFNQIVPGWGQRLSSALIMELARGLIHQTGRSLGSDGSPNQLCRAPPLFLLPGSTGLMEQWL